MDVKNLLRGLLGKVFGDQAAPDTSAQFRVPSWEDEGDGFVSLVDYLDARMELEKSRSPGPDR